MLAELIHHIALAITDGNLKRQLAGEGMGGAAEARVPGD